MAGNKYEITAKDGSKYEINANDDAEAQRLEGFINGQIDAGQTDPTKWKPDRAQVLPAQADPEDALISDIGSGVAEIGRGVLEGGANVLDQAADWTQSGLNALGGAVGAGSIGNSLNSAWGDGKNDLVGQIAPQAEGMGTLRGMGKFVGEAGASAPLAGLRGGAAVQGAASGALLSDKNDLLGVGMDALAGAAGGYGASALLRGASKLADPVVDEGLKTLITSGIRVTPGQYGRSTGGKLGARIARSEDRAISTPFVGDRIVADRNQSLDDFAKATINRAVEPIGASLPPNIKPGRAAVKWAGDKLSAEYDAILPNLSVSGDGKFLDSLQTIAGDAQTLAPARVEQFNSILGSLGRYWQGGTNLTGEALKSIDTRLSDRIRRFSSSPDADQQDLGDALQSVRDAVHDLAARQNPDYAGRLSAVNKGWKGLVQVEKASGNSKAGISPAGYSQAVKQSSDTTRRRGYSRGEALNQDLADAGSDILPSEISDSGTAGRWQQSNIPSLLVGAAQLPAYAAARGAIPLLTRESGLSPQLAKLLGYGARAAPIAAPAAIDVLGQ